MRDFNKRGGYGNDRFDGRNRGFDRRGGGRDRGDFGRDRDSEREMFDAVCDNCGRNCKVPFRPSSDKPIYCNECFRERGGNDGGDRGGRDRNFHDRENSSHGSVDVSDLKRQLDMLSSKLDRVLNALEISSLLKKADETEVKEAKPKKVAKAKKTVSMKAKKKEIEE